jgi:hypothetical protein
MVDPLLSDRSFRPGLWAAFWIVLAVAIVALAVSFSSARRLPIYIEPPPAEEVIR